MSFSSLAAFLWSVADLLRGDYKQSDYGKVILPFTLLRRLDCVLDATKAGVLKEYEARKNTGIAMQPFLLRAAKQSFYNTSRYDFQKFLDDPNNIKATSSTTFKALAKIRATFLRSMNFRVRSNV